MKWGLGAVTAGLIVLALPASLEGPTLFRVSPGHAVSTVDAVGVILLCFGSLILYRLLWAQRLRLAQWTSRRPVLVLGGVFVSGLGLGLLVASAFSSFFWWWAVGAVLFGSTVVWASIAVTRRPHPERKDTA